MSFRKSLFKNLLTLGGYNYSSQAANFLASIVLSRLLVPEEYGYVALITVFTGFVTIFSDAGISYVIIRSDYGRTFWRAVTNLSFYIGLALFGIMLILAWPIALFYDDASLVIPTMVMALTFIASALKIAPMAVFTKELNFNFVGKVRLIANLTSIGMMIIMAFLGFSYWSLIIPQILMHLVEFILFEYKLRLGFKIYPWCYTKAAYRKTKSLLTNLSGFNLVNYWARNADNLIIGKFYSSYDLGIYNRAYKMLQLSLSLITGLFGTVLYPSLKKFTAEGGDLNPEYGGLLGVISLLNYPISAVLILIPYPFVRVLWGENWMLVADLLPYFGVLIMFQTLISTTGHIYLLLEHERRFMLIGVGSAILMVIAIVIGSFYSMKAVAISYAFCYMLLIVPLHIYVGFYKTFKFKFSFIWKFWFPKIIFGIAMMFAVFYELQTWLYIILPAYLIHLLYNQRTELSKLKGLILNRINK
ncbi:MAG: lipopolysaccharide biosynthesis protein [Bacteroidales bacterium]|nr:lipopolysaccharide biosynthesis protein [Bacteroidales bacterium]MCF8405347.1 lipopolysaccharide biosynthesis protein [Bacteroidales bacterium]